MGKRPGFNVLDRMPAHGQLIGAWKRHDDNSARYLERLGYGTASRCYK